jgi:hypothetical protein
MEVQRCCNNSRLSELSFEDMSGGLRRENRHQFLKEVLLFQEN